MGAVPCTTVDRRVCRQLGWLYQHITDSIFIKEHYPMEHTQDQDTSIPTLDYNEKYALRYVLGYVT